MSENIPKPRLGGKGRMFIATCAMFGFFFMIAAVIFIPIPAENRELFLILIGTLSAGFTAVIGYYLGAAESGAENRNETTNPRG